MLSHDPDYLARDLLSGGSTSVRRQQEPVCADQPRVGAVHACFHPAAERADSWAVLSGRAHSDRRWLLLSAGARERARRLLPGRPSSGRTTVCAGNPHHTGDTTRASRRRAHNTRHPGNIACASRHDSVSKGNSAGRRLLRADATASDKTSKTPSLSVRHGAKSAGYRLRPSSRGGASRRARYDSVRVAGSVAAPTASASAAGAEARTGRAPNHAAKTVMP
jgi:hypothetical protein